MNKWKWRLKKILLKINNEWNKPLSLSLYIYIYRERETDRQTDRQTDLHNLSLILKPVFFYLFFIYWSIFIKFNDYYIIYSYIIISIS